MTGTVGDVKALRGRIVRFDGGKGYGFIAPEGGGDDVFVHVNELDVDESEIRSGIAVEFKLLDSGRGPKAYDVRVLDRVKRAAPAVSPQQSPESPLGEDECDVLSESAFRHEVTEVIIQMSPSSTGEQIANIRAGLCDLARRHGWVT